MALAPLLPALVLQLVKCNCSAITFVYSNERRHGDGSSVFINLNSDFRPLSSKLEDDETVPGGEAD